MKIGQIVRISGNRINGWRACNVNFDEFFIVREIFFSGTQVFLNKLNGEPFAPMFETDVGGGAALFMPLVPLGAAWVIPATNIELAKLRLNYHAK